MMVSPSGLIARYNTLVGMARQRRNHVERWVFPDADLVLGGGGGESVRVMSGDQMRLQT